MTTTPTPLLALSDVSKHYSVRNGRARRRAVLKAVDGVSLDVMASETFALVGESGSGKSTLGQLAVRLTDSTEGSVHFDGQDITQLRGKPLRALRPSMQVVFQDPLGSLNPRMTAGAIVAEPLRVIEGLGGSELDDRVDELFGAVGLDPARRTSRPRALSGGQRQRVGIARAIALNPRLILADEALSALDVSVQAQITNLLVELRERLGLSYLYIGHGLPVVRQLAQRVGVMYLGRMVETGTRDEVLADPQHPYTRALVSASPVPDPRIRRERIVLSGEPPQPLALPSGCRFRTRCQAAMPVCAEVEPTPIRLSPTRVVECHLAG